MVKNSKTKYGVWSLLNSYNVLRVLLDGDIDFVIFDLEHGYWRRDQLATAVDLCQKNGKYAVVRIPNATQEWVQLAYDANVDVLQIAGIRSQTDIDDLIVVTNYPPIGNLGFSPWTPQGYGHNLSVDRSPKISIQIEDIALLNKLIDGSLRFPPKIVSIFIGRYDLSVSMGIPGQIENVEIMDLIKSAQGIALDLGLVLGTVSNTGLDAQKLQKIGTGFISLGSDVQRLLIQTANKES